MRVRIIETTFFLTLAMLLPGLASEATSSIYDECILESMKGVKSDVAAESIMRSCRNKDAAKRKPKSRALSPEEIRQLTGRAGQSTSMSIPKFSGNIYNGNENVTVSEIAVEITTTIDEKKVSWIYRQVVTINPQTVGFFSFNILKGDKDADYSWGISSAKGY